MEEKIAFVEEAFLDWLPHPLYDRNLSSVIFDFRIQCEAEECLNFATKEFTKYFCDTCYVIKVDEFIMRAKVMDLQLKMSGAPPPIL